MMTLDFLDPVSVAVGIVIGTAVVLFFTSTKAKADTYTVLTSVRRSLGTPELYSGAPAPSCEIQRALECAVRAPNHWLSEPWRFRLLNDEQKAQIVELTKFDGKKPLFAKVPQMMVVSLLPSGETWGVKALEDHAATACAVQNFMVYLASQGIGTKWLTGAMGMDGEQILGEVCGIDDTSTEHYMGVIMIGMPAQPLTSIAPPKRKKGLGPEILTKF